MKQIIGCFLSFILLLQTTVYSQTMYPTKQQVAEIYQKVYNRVNSSNIFKDFSSDNQITPLLALEIIASDVQIKNQQDLADWLQKFDIPIRPDASVVDIYNEVYSRFQTERFANDIGIESIDKQYHDAAVFLNMINKKDPTILPNCDEYLRTIKELDIEYEAENLGIEQASACTERYLENIENLFAESCKRVNVNPIVVINAYVNYTQIPDLVQSTVDEENLLSNFTRKLSVLKGWYLGWRELTATKGEEKALSAIVKKYVKDYDLTQRNYTEQVEALENYWKRIENTDNPLLMKMFRQRENFVRNIELKHLEAEGKMIPTQTLSEGKILSIFTESGALALSILALFDIARHFIKVENIKAYSSGKNQRELALLDAIEENKSHLFAFLEQLPDNERNTAFAYIAENYFDDFQNQTQNLLYALAVLENKGLPGYAPENIQQKVSDKFDQSYLNMEKKLQQIDLNI